MDKSKNLPSSSEDSGERLMQRLKDSGFTVQDLEPPKDTAQLKATFVPEQASQSKQQSE